MARRKVSLVVANRNDDYAGVTERFSHMLDYVAWFQARYPGCFQLVVVEYNPPPDRPSLREQYRWENIKPLKLITVPAERHEQIADGSRMPFFEYIAKNIGIRRADGDYITITNTEDYFSLPLLERLAHGQLHRDRFYTCFRPDVDGEKVRQTPANKLSDRLPQYVVRPNRYSLYRWVEPPGVLGHRWPIRTMGRQLFKLYNRLYWTNDKWLGRMAKSFDFLRFAIPTEALPRYVAAQGDFFLAHRDAWHRVRGARECIGPQSANDCFLTVQFHAGGYDHTLLPASECVYHEDHETTPEDQAYRRATREQLAIFTRLNQELLHQQPAAPVNDAEWGRPDWSDLPEWQQ